MTGSYVSTKFSVNTNNELERLRNQIDLFWDKESIHYQGLALGENARILECGSGSGYYLTKLVDMYPDADFFSLEVDPEYVAVQKELYSQAPYNKITVINSPIESADLPENHFDLIVMRLVLEHLSDPESVVAQLRRLLKVGGRLLLIDNDFHNHLLTYPHIEELSDLYDAYCRMRVEEGGNPYIGRELPGMLQRHGFSKIDFDSITAHSVLTGDVKFLSSESSAIGLTLVEGGYIPIKTYEALSRKWSEVLLEDNHAYFRNLYVCSGIKETPEIEAVQTPKADKSARTGTAKRSTSITQTGDTLSVLSQKWSEILETDSVNVDENIFELGGTSLMILNIKQFVQKELGKSLPASFFFQHPTIRELSNAIDNHQGETQKEPEGNKNNLKSLKDRFKKK